ncbi:TRAP-type C4-dicarboxylate transport system, small permease component [Octadecabacter temperatus]|uniref:TRAP transporter small permease protein n=1 Tax=Octadecabacter temperatus TaxID=1458307 RepID=A0A0K0Y722_9RHOB|nr:TRAP transporter small permease [Octadecabacter temperatus]AKS46672.1 Tripartite ATP-independent periplasmic transporter, DctQ component [Octadecabacter temperatus]SIO19022.1 TRAP-type C4-dicarboxylate transport system, small permease component [Octadecabacter temperatus]
MSSRKTIIERCETVLAGVQWASIFTASIALVVLIVTFGWLVFGRYVLNVTPTWVEQLALMLICYIAFLGAAAGVRDDTHLGVTLFRDITPIHVQKTVIIIIDFMLATFGAIMFLAGTQLMAFGWDSLIPMLDVPESFRTMAITICGALIVLHAGSRGIIRILSYSDWLPDPEANTEAKIDNSGQEI